MNYIFSCTKKWLSLWLKKLQVEPGPAKYYFAVGNVTVVRHTIASTTMCVVLAS